METERPIKDCLKLLKRDMRLISLAQPAREITKEHAELISVLDSMANLAINQLRVAREQECFQEARC